MDPAAAIARAPRRTWLVLSAALCAGCAPAPAPAPTLAVTQFRHDRAEGVLLGEPLVVHFSAPLDPRSVTSESVRVVDGSGRPARGDIEVLGRRLVFTPDLPLAADLSGPGLEPGRRYTLRLVGFPRVDALRSRQGAPLVRTFTSDFSTVPGAVSPTFLDDAPERRARLSLADARVAAGEPWTLVSDKALDPRSISDDRFVLATSRTDADGRARLETSALRARLVHNRPGEARVELMPVDERGLPRLLEVGDHVLVESPGGRGLVDLGGAPAAGPWSSLVLGARLSVESASPPPTGPRVLETFSTDALASPRAVAGSVGQARWEGDGRVRLSYPRAAGDGRDGAVTLAGPEARERVAATDLLVEEGAEVVLGAEGTVVLAAQGTLRVEGRLVRRVQEGSGRRGEGESHQDWLRRIKRPGESSVEWLRFEPRESLSEFLARARAAEMAVTVLVAGGDLVVSGEIDCDGPLVLVAGGRVRIPGAVQASEAWITAPYGRSGVNAWLDTLPLEIDQPDTNPLRRQQTWSVVSGPIRPGAGFRRWVAARTAGYAPERSDAASGTRYVVRFVGARQEPDGRLVETEPVSDLRLLEDCPIVRVRIDLVVEAAGSGRALPWDPPWVDEVELVFE